MTVTLYIDVSTGNLLTSLSNATVTPSLGIPLFAGDSGMILVVFLMQPLQMTNPSTYGYSIIPTTGLSLQAFLDNGENPLTTSGAANPNYVIYTQQTTFTTVNSQYFTGSFPLNTAAIAGLFTTNTSATAVLHIGYLSGGNTQTVLYDGVTLQPGIASNVGPVPSGLTPLSQQAGDQRYVMLTGAAGQGFILTSPLGKQLLVEAIDSGGAAIFQANPIN